MTTENPEISSPQLRGREVIRRYVAELPGLPGVYRMLDAEGKALYIGKASNLRNRVSSYLKVETLPVRLQLMVDATARMEITITGSEAEALLLEASLVRHTQPRYNILLKDDKSFPYIHLSGDHEFPRLGKHRGQATGSGDYFGPFVSALAVNETITTLQKAFLLRPCSDQVFRNRSRPCLQYQIKRCSGPCVGKISKDDYEALVKEARRFLTGESRQLQDDLKRQMDELSTSLQYEKAAQLRDRIRALSLVQSQQNVQAIIEGAADVVAMHREGSKACILMTSFRGGRNLGSRSYFPAQIEIASTDAEVLSAFLAQFYQSHEPPTDIYISHLLEETHLLEEAFAMRAGRKVSIQFPMKGNKRAVVLAACKNAEQALRQHLAVTEESVLMMQKLQELFDLPVPPSRIEVYDNSHVMGSHPVSAMIVAGPEGFRKTAYRKFRMDQLPAAGSGDDYAMMASVIRRRFRRLQEQGDQPGSAQWPDLVLIDGGQGQLSAVMAVLEEMGVEGVAVVAIAKGPDRNAGQERFFMPERAPFQLDPSDPLLHYLQRLRDEAHRFAIGFHRDRRSRAIRNSGLDEVPSIGPRRRRALLTHFGSVKAITAASVEELQKVSGISRDIAQRIYDHFRGI